MNCPSSHYIGETSLSNFHVRDYHSNALMRFPSKIPLFAESPLILMAFFFLNHFYSFFESGFRVEMLMTLVSWCWNQMNKSMAHSLSWFFDQVQLSIFCSSIWMPIYLSQLQPGLKLLHRTSHGHSFPLKNDQCEGLALDVLHFWPLKPQDVLEKKELSLILLLSSKKLLTVFVWNAL